MANTIPDNRPLTHDEAALVLWMLERGTAPAARYLTQLADARVVSRCGDGSASVNFAVGGVTPPHGGPIRVLADFEYRTAEGHVCEAIVFERAGLLAGLEVWSVDGLSTPSALPAIEQLEPVLSRDRPRSKVVGGRQLILADEPEWLARPARWGLQHLPASRQERISPLFNHHYYRRIAEWIACPICRPLVQELFAEDGGIRIPDALVWPDNVDRRIGREKFRTWYSAQHPVRDCDAQVCLKFLLQYQSSFITEAELLGKLHESLCELTDRHGREADRTALERELALELIGPNPFRPIAFDPSWLTSTSTALARTMDESRDFSAMSILADALEDAGCEHTEVLSHCRGSGPHVRGCWVVDLLLGKE